MSLLLRHGADTEMCNNMGQRPIDVADDDQVIDLLRQHTDGAHLADDVTSIYHAPTGAVKRQQPPTAEEESDDEVDVVLLKKSKYDNPADDVQTFDYFEPLDLSIHTGTADLVRSGTDPISLLVTVLFFLFILLLFFFIKQNACIGAVTVEMPAMSGYLCVCFSRL